MSGDKKITQLPEQTSVNSRDLLLIIVNPTTTPVSKKITLKNLLDNVPANTNFGANVSFSGNRVNMNSNLTVEKLSTVNNMIMLKKAAPSTNNTSTASVVGIDSLSVGSIWFSNSHLYIATDSTTIKRIPLEVF